ncbi:MAG: hypothetical protein LBD85_06780, partial [Oscillospiraceae bacterium]|nr:hypothetical protein [Oscillospiraceae bacterium]
FKAVLEGNKAVVLRFGGGTLVRKRRGGERRIELLTDNAWYYRRQEGYITETVGAATRVFIPTDPAVGVPLLRALFRQHPVAEVRASFHDESLDDASESQAKALAADAAASGGLYRPSHEAPGPGRAVEIDGVEVAKGPPRPLSDIISDIGKTFNVPITSKRFRARRGAVGLYNAKYGQIMVRFHNSASAVMHELGHHLDAAHGFTEANAGKLAGMAKGFPQEVKNAYRKKDLPGEAFADFVELYMTNPEGAREFGGLGGGENFYDAFGLFCQGPIYSYAVSVKYAITCTIHRVSIRIKAGGRII